MQKNHQNNKNTNYEWKILELNMSIQLMCKNKVLAHNGLLLAEKQHLTGCKAVFSQQGHPLRSGSADSRICFSCAYVS